MSKIHQLKAREIIDSRAKPTLEVELVLSGGFKGRASVPSGASTGIHEALELRDNDTARFNGKGVLKAVEKAGEIFSQIKDKEFSSQEDLDNFLIILDGTDNKSNLGANTILAISMAYAQANALKNDKKLFEYIGESFGNSYYKMPVPMFNVLNGGRHANWATDVQEFMLIPQYENYLDNLKSGCEIFGTIEKILSGSGENTNVGNEGGFAPGFAKTEDALEFLEKAIESTGYSLQNVKIGLDIAASEFFDKVGGKYVLKKGKGSYSPNEWQIEIERWVNDYSILSVEDPFDQDSWENWQEFSLKNSENLNIVGDDLLVTNTGRIKTAIEKRACNTVLIKPNQIGTITETLNAVKLAQLAGWKTVISHRSGETEDVFISHLSVGTGSDFIKAGAPNRSERTAKYNELIRIQEQLLNG